MYYQNRGYLLTNRQNAPSAISMPVYYTYPKCTVLEGRVSFNTIVENGILHEFYFNNTQQCTGIATHATMKCNSINKPTNHSDSDFRWLTSCADKQRTVG